jgi:microcompartment protein CcmL/EutN
MAETVRSSSFSSSRGASAGVVEAEATTVAARAAAQTAVARPVLPRGHPEVIAIFSTSFRVHVPSLISWKRDGRTIHASAWLAAVDTRNRERRVQGSVADPLCLLRYSEKESRI